MQGTSRFVVHKLPVTTGADQTKRAVRRFVAQTGSIESARRALELLALLEEVRGPQQNRKAA